MTRDPLIALGHMRDRHTTLALAVIVDDANGVDVAAESGDFRGRIFPSGVSIDRSRLDGKWTRTTYDPDGKPASDPGVRVTTGDGWRAVEVTDGADPDTLRRSTELPG